MENFLEAERARRLELRSTFRFRSTNEIWNKLGLNLGWSIGYLTRLFKAYRGKDYTDWVTFYESSGNERLHKIQELPIHKQKILMDFTLRSTGRYQEVRKLTNEDKNLNDYYGRTQGELNEIAGFMYKEIVKKGNPLALTRNECRDFVRIRVLDEIFIGVEREINTRKTLEKAFPTLRFEEVDVRQDSTYAVDFEVYQEDKLLLALQVKSNNYKISNNDMLKETKQFNQHKHEAYKRKYGVKVAYVFSDVDGLIHNSEVYKDIQSHLS